MTTASLNAFIAFQLWNAVIAINYRDRWWGKLAFAYLGLVSGIWSIFSLLEGHA